MERYKLIDHTADIGIEIYGKDLPRLFSNAGYAVFDILTDLSLVKNKVVRNVAVTGRNLEELMANWLSELLYIFEKEELIINLINVIDIDTSSLTLQHEEKKSAKLNAEIRGEKYDSDIHLLNTMIKAVTFHKLEVVKNGSGWRSKVILDV